MPGTIVVQSEEKTGGKREELMHSALTTPLTRGSGCLEWPVDSGNTDSLVMIDRHSHLRPLVLRTCEKNSGEFAVVTYSVMNAKRGVNW